MKWTVRILMVCGVFTLIGLVGLGDWQEQPRPSLVVVDTREDGGRTVYQLELANPTGMELEYWGYGAASPMYQMAELEDRGWEPVLMGWCGMGAAPQRLGPHQRQRFEVMPAEPTVVKVGLLLLPPRSDTGRVYQFALLPDSWRSGLVQWQNDRLEERLRRKVVWSEPLAPLPPASQAPVVAAHAGVMPQ